MNSGLLYNIQYTVYREVSSLHAAFLCQITLQILVLAYHINEIYYLGEGTGTMFRVQVCLFSFIIDLNDL